MKTTLKNFILSIAVFTTAFTFAQSEAIYNISLTTEWTVAGHSSVPGNAHWSPLVGATHNTANEFVSLGTLATTGIKNVAEGGNNTAIKNEINAAINISPIEDRRADQLLETGFAPFAGDDSNASFSNITVSQDFSLITLVSMVAPSPDWFIAVNSLDLRSGDPTIDNGWRNDFTIDVFAYDSGTDNGSDYTSGNSANSPVPVFMISGAPINGNKMATITFDYISSTLGVDEVASIENVRVYPNPATNVLNITNTVNNNLDSAELYNVLGKKVNAVSTSNGNDIAINTSALQSGIYVLRLHSTEGAISTRKVIID